MKGECVIVVGIPSVRRVEQDAVLRMDIHCMAVGSLLLAGQATAMVRPREVPQRKQDHNDNEVGNCLYKGHGAGKALLAEVKAS